LNDFASSLSLADNVIFAPIYPAREQDIYGVSSQDIANKIKDYNTSALCLGNYEKITEHIKNIAKGEDIVIIMGAGSIYKAREALLKA